MRLASSLGITNNAGKVAEEVMDMRKGVDSRRFSQNKSLNACSTATTGPTLFAPILRDEYSNHSSFLGLEVLVVDTHSH